VRGFQVQDFKEHVPATGFANQKRADQFAVIEWQIDAVTVRLPAAIFIAGSTGTASAVAGNIL